jgi:hypothetical protein
MRESSAPTLSADSECASGRESACPARLRNPRCGWRNTQRGQRRLVLYLREIIKIKCFNRAFRDKHHTLERSCRARCMRKHYGSNAALCDLSCRISPILTSKSQDKSQECSFSVRTERRRQFPSRLIPILTRGKMMFSAVAQSDNVTAPCSRRPRRRAWSRSALGCRRACAASRARR